MVTGSPFCALPCTTSDPALIVAISIVIAVSAKAIEAVLKKTAKDWVIRFAAFIIHPKGLRCGNYRLTQLFGIPYDCLKDTVFFSPLQRSAERTLCFAQVRFPSLSIAFCLSDG